MVRCSLVRSLTPKSFLGTLYKNQERNYSMKNSKNIARIGLVAALYVVLTLLVPAFAYGPVQFRISEVLTLLCFYNPFYILPITLGVFISNLFSSLGPIDLVFGTLHTLISVYLMSKTKNIWLASLMPALFSFIIGAQIVMVSTEALSFFAITGSIMLSEFIIVTIIGVPVFKLLEKNKDFKDKVLDYNLNI